MKDGYLWEPRFVTKREIDFECKQIKKLLNLDGSQSYSDSKVKNEPQCDMVIAVGFVSFPAALLLKDYFKRVVLLDNTGGSVEAYQKKFGNTGKVETLIFTSTIGNPVTNIRKLYHAADLVIVGGGCTSFFKNPKVYYEYVNTWLKEEGIAYFSYYNTDFIYDYVDRVTLDDNMDFRPVPETRIAKVNLIPRSKYHIYCNLVD